MGGGGGGGVGGGGGGAQTLGVSNEKEKPTSTPWNFYILTIFYLKYVILFA